MSYENLYLSSKMALKKIDEFEEKNGNWSIFETIRAQIIFINTHAYEKKNPVAYLKENQSFTFGVISSKEFSSPDELNLKKYFDKIFDDIRSIQK